MNTKTTYTLIETTSTTVEFDSKLEAVKYLMGQIADDMQEAASCPDCDTPENDCHQCEQPPVIDAILADLNHPKFTLRKLSTLEEKYGVDVIEELKTHEISYVIKTKRGTGEKLIGLARRN